MSCIKKYIFICVVCVSPLLAQAADRDAHVTLSGEPTIVSGDTAEYELEIFNTEIQNGGYTDPDAQVQVVYDIGLEFAGEGDYDPPGFATLVSTNNNTLVWDIDSLTTTLFDPFTISFFLEGIIAGQQTATATIIPGPSAPPEDDTANNTSAYNTNVIQTTTDGACGTASGAVYYSGYVFSASPELCSVGTPLSGNPDDVGQPSVAPT